VEGKNNLNNTSQNSAKVGDVLKLPEIGWIRYDDKDIKFIYTGSNWTHIDLDIYDGYKSTESYTLNSMGDGLVTFKFYGTKIRLLQSMYQDVTYYGTDSGIIIDGVKENFNKTNASVTSTSNCRQHIVYEKTGLTLGVHTVTIVSSSSGLYRLENDAIDIDDTGSLLPSDYNKSIALDNTSMSLKVNDTQPLTATTTPAGVGVKWKSSNESVAKYDSSTGKVVGVGEGTCTITATIDDGYNVASICTVTVTKKDEPQPTTPTEPTTGDSNLFIELVDGNIKSYNVSSAEITKFKQWYLDRDNTKSNKPYYEFAKGTYKDYVIHDKIDWFEVR